MKRCTKDRICWICTHHHHHCLYKKASANVLRLWGLPTWKRSELDNWWLMLPTASGLGIQYKQPERAGCGERLVCWMRLNAIYFPFLSKYMWRKIFSEMSSISCEVENQQIVWHAAFKSRILTTIWRKLQHAVCDPIDEANKHHWKWIMWCTRWLQWALSCLWEVEDFLELAYIFKYF